MHHCLHVDEIVRLIARELVASQGQATAVALACCCKSLEDPALDVLWTAQYSLTSLLKTLSEDIWNTDDNNVSVATTVFVPHLFNCLIQKSLNRLPTIQEWARLRKYARRIQMLEGELIPSSLSQVFSALQFRTFGEALLPSLKTLRLWYAPAEYMSFIPTLLSARTTAITISFFEHEHREVVVAAMITALPVLCPNLQEIHLNYLPEHPAITAAVSQLLLTTNPNTLRSFGADSPLTEEAHEVVYKLADLRELSTVVDGLTSLPTIVLPNLTMIGLVYHNHNWLQGFSGASLENLDTIILHSVSKPIDDFLEAFEDVAQTTAITATVSAFKFSTSHPWRPKYRSLFPFTQLTELIIGFSCQPDCSSTIDDDIVTDLARALPKLQGLHLGHQPCRTPAGVTVQGLSALAHYCPHLCDLSIHFRPDSLDPPGLPRVTFANERSVSWEDCALKILGVGKIRIPEESALMVALTLLRIFPHLEEINYEDESWEGVANAIGDSKDLVTCSSKARVFAALRIALTTLPTGLAAIR